MKITHYDIDSLNGTVFIYGYNDSIHSTNCSQPLLTPDPTNLTNIENLQFCSNEYESNQTFDNQDYVRGRYEDLANLSDGRNDTNADSETDVSSSASYALSVYVINVFLSSVLFFNLLSYSVNIAQRI